MMGILAWLLAALADFQRIIEYFGIGAVFIWLYFLERGDSLKRDKGEGEQAQRNIELITKYYQASWIFFGMAVLAEYALSEEFLTKLFGTVALTLVNYLTIIFGLVMFAVPSYLVYTKISEHTTYEAMSVPKVGKVLYAALLGLIHTALLWGLSGSLQLDTTIRILAATFVISYLGIGASFTKWGAIKGWHTRLVLALTYLPWLTLYMIVVSPLLAYL